MKANVEFPVKLQCLFQSARYKVLWGGRGGAKSWGIARALLIIGANKATRVLCAREFQTSIRDSVHKLLCDQIGAMGLTDFYEITDRTIRGKNGSEFNFVGLKNNVANVKSYEGVDICWVEEAQSVSGRSWATLIPTIRKEQSLEPLQSAALKAFLPPTLQNIGCSSWASCLFWLLCSCLTAY